MHKDFSMNKFILLAGESNAGKSTLASLLGNFGYRSISTSTILRSHAGIGPSREGDTLAMLFKAGSELDKAHPEWIFNQASDLNQDVVVDAIRSDSQLRSFGKVPHLTINVVTSTADADARAKNRQGGVGPTYLFPKSDITWNTSRDSISWIINRISNYGSGCVDAVIGGQYGSEGKGKLVDLLAPGYNSLVRSGGPNAGHWVRTPEKEFCFHQIPSGLLSNPNAKIYIAAGATIEPDALIAEMEALGLNHPRAQFYIDRQTPLITQEDRDFETSALVSSVGSTASGAGAAAARRVMRGGNGQVQMAGSHIHLNKHAIDVSITLQSQLFSGGRVLLEGTQGSGLSLYHGPYPYTTSRDTNISGLLSECGIAPTWLRNTWMVVRSHPIRVAGNSGPMSNEISWEEVSTTSNRTPDSLRNSEITSTTKRQRRVGAFENFEFLKAARINRPTHLFLTFADYISPMQDISNWDLIPIPVAKFVDNLECLSGVPVAGISYGKMRADVIWRPGYEPVDRTHRSHYNTWKI